MLYKFLMLLLQRRWLSTSNDLVLSHSVYGWCSLLLHRVHIAPDDCLNESIFHQDDFFDTLHDGP